MRRAGLLPAAAVRARPLFLRSTINTGSRRGRRLCEEWLSEGGVAEKLARSFSQGPQTSALASICGVLETTFC